MFFTINVMLLSSKMMKFTWLLLCFCLLAFYNLTEANQVDNLSKLIKFSRSHNSRRSQSWEELYAAKEYSPVYIGDQDGLMQADKISALPGQPDGTDFDHYAGYVTIDPNAGKALFYYFVESPHNSSTNPLVLWLSGGPGCSSLGFGAMEELGPFRVKSDGKTLFRNDYAWNNVANVIFLESPAGVGFSYSNTSSDYNRPDDKSTADDAYTFLVNWLERFPQYKTRDFFITGESYAGHYVPQLANTILLNNKSTNRTIINLKGIAVGNAWVDLPTGTHGTFDYLWTHAIISDETYESINMYCNDFTNISAKCSNFSNTVLENVSQTIDVYNIYAPRCLPQTNSSSSSVYQYDPCSDNYVLSYLNIAEVQKALHANPIKWIFCGVLYNPSDDSNTVLPIIKSLMASGLRIWMYSGDTDSIVPVTSTRYAIKRLGVTVRNEWRAWYTKKGEVGGYVEVYGDISSKGEVTFVTVRGAGHKVPSYQPQPALTLISSFLQGILPP